MASRARVKGSAILPVAVAAVLSAAAYGQVETVWERNYGSGNPAGSVFHTQVSFDSGYVLAGFVRDSASGNTDLFFVKLSPAGDSVWQLLVPVDTFGIFPTDCYLTMKRVSDSDFVAAGLTFIESGNDSADPVLVKVRDHGAGGEVLWARPVGNPGIDDEARALEETENGRYVVAGTCRRDHGGFVGKDFYVALADRDGNLIGDTAFRATRNDYATSIVRCHAGTDRFLVAGLCYPFDSGPQVDEADVFLVKFEVDGSSFRVLEDTVVGMDRVDEEARWIVATPDGGYAVGGMHDVLRVSSDDSLHLKDHLLMKLERHLGVVWELYYGNYYGDSTMTDNGTFLLAQEDGSFLMTGYFEVPGSHRDMAFLEVDEWGRKQWHASWGDAGNDYGQCITPLGGREFLLTGFARCVGTQPLSPGSQARLYAVKVRVTGSGVDQGPGPGSGSNRPASTLVRDRLRLSRLRPGEDLRVALVGTDGRLVKSAGLTADRHGGATLAVSGLPAGVYLVRFAAQGYSSTQKLVINR